MLADNTDLANKIFASEESWNAWKAIPDTVKNLLGNNIDYLVIESIFRIFLLKIKQW